MPFGTDKCMEDSIEVHFIKALGFKLVGIVCVRTIELLVEIFSRRNSLRGLGINLGVKLVHVHGLFGSLSERERFNFLKQR